VRSVEQAPPVANRVEQRLHFARLRHVEQHQQRGPEFAGSASPVKALFVGTSAEFGNVWSLDSPISAGPLKQSYSFFTSMTTSFAPLYVGVALAPGGRRNFYFQLGRTY